MKANITIRKKSMKLRNPRKNEQKQKKTARQSNLFMKQGKKKIIDGGRERESE